MGQYFLDLSRCWSCGVSCMHNGCSTITALELELTWLSLLGSLSGLHSDLNQILFQEKVGWFSQSYVLIYFNHSSNQNKHTKCNASFIWTGIRIGSTAITLQGGFDVLLFPIAKTLHLLTCNIMNVALVHTTQFLSFTVNKK